MYKKLKWSEYSISERKVKGKLAMGQKHLEQKGIYARKILVQRRIITLGPQTIDLIL